LELNTKLVLAQESGNNKRVVGSWLGNSVNGIQVGLAFSQLVKVHLGLGQEQERGFVFGRFFKHHISEVSALLVLMGLVELLQLLGHLFNLISG
jgi:hypothetical protein